MYKSSNDNGCIYSLNDSYAKYDDWRLVLNFNYYFNYNLNLYA